MTQEELDEKLDEVFNEFGYCRCGMPEHAAKYLLKVLTLLDRKPGAAAPDVIKELGEPAMLVLYALDKEGLIEHGGSVLGAWLTPRGRDTMETLRKLSL